YTHIYDSLHYIGYPHTFKWKPMSYPGASSFGGAGYSCTGDSVMIDPSEPPGTFSYDTLHTKTNICSSNNFTAYRTGFRHALIRTRTKMAIDVAINTGGDVPAGDSIV